MIPSLISKGIFPSFFIVMTVPWKVFLHMILPFVVQYCLKVLFLAGLSDFFEDNSFDNC